MKTVTASLLFLVFGFVLFSCNNAPKKHAEQKKIIKASVNTADFNAYFDTVLMNYDSLRAAMINWDSTGADSAAKLLTRAVVYTPYSEIKDDETATKATSIAQNAGDELDAMRAQKTLADKRRMFYTVSESLYNLAKTVHYDRQVLYHKKCPMAFNGDEEGWWFSESKTIDNPYYGRFHPKYKNAMMSCGSVEDSINNMQ